MSPTDESQREVEPPPEVEPPMQRDIISDKTANLVIVVVTSMWVLNLLVDMFSEYLKIEYVTSGEIHGIFMAVVGGAFIARSKARGG